MRIWSCLLALSVAIGAPAYAAEHKAGDVVIETRSVTTADGQEIPYELGTLFVPENRTAAQSRIIGVGFARIRSTRSGETVPTFHLPGGPGESDLNALLQSDAASQRDLGQLLRYRAIGDVVVIDQRGFSERGEMLRFSPRPVAQPLDRPGSQAAETALFVAASKAAVAANRDKDLSGYTVIQCVEDVNDLRRALGYDKIVPVGQSFGSQWGFAILRLHPEIVKSALLSGVEPLDYAYDMPSHIFAALARIAFEADRDPGLKPYLPEGGVLAAVRSVRERLLRGPIKTVVQDAKTGQRRTVALGLEDFQRALLRPDEPRHAEDWPAFILSVYHGHYDDWAREAMEDRAALASDAPLIGPLIDTSLGVSKAREHLLRTDSGVAFLGQWNFDSYIASASVWPSPDVGDAFRTPTPSEIPVLFVQGDWDLETPMENMLNMLPYFPNARAILAHRGPHGARYRLFGRQPEIMDAALEFLSSGETKNLPTSVPLQAAPFRTPAFPAPASVGPR